MKLMIIFHIWHFCCTYNTLTSHSRDVAAIESGEKVVLPLNFTIFRLHDRHFEKFQFQDIWTWDIFVFAFTVSEEFIDDIFLIQKRTQAHRELHLFFCLRGKCNEAISFVAKSKIQWLCFHGLEWIINSFKLIFKWYWQQQWFVLWTENDVLC